MNGFKLDKPYRRTDFVEFLQRDFLPEDYTAHEEEMDLEFQPQYINEVFYLGDCPGMELSVYEITHGSEHDPRVSLTREIFRLMKEYNSYNALAVFRSPNSENYRLSYITMDQEAEGTKVKDVYSNPRRYSYFLGPDAKVGTPDRFLLKRGRVTSLEDLQDRFSVEVVNREFYNEIATLFTRLVGGERKNGNNTVKYDGLLSLHTVTDRKKMQEFVVRMIGRIVFCWFLKKKTTGNGKPLIPDDILSLAAVESVIKNNRLYYHRVLEPLFFQVLNTPQEKRLQRFREGLFSEIPFLNGGLFEPHTDDVYECDSFSGESKHLNTVDVPDEWLRDFLELLERYNFTIDENTTIDVELSVDPEMLGRIFENLLAEINPETGETARKSSGSYYTPRPIVEYMVDESLKQYLSAKTGIDNDKLNRLLSFSHDVEDLTKEERRRIIDHLDEVKIIDPACGSGAFPMGILQKMLLAYQKADPELKIWRDKQLDAIPDPYLRNIVEERLKNDDWDYIRKLGIIQSSIYGVDIQQIAVEISKLRVFLSLVVDSKIRDNQPNKGIKALPNLEFKFVCANTLVGLAKGNEGLFEAIDEIKILKSLRDSYFTSVDQKKREIEKKFKETQVEMFRHSQEMGTTGKRTKALSNWDPFSCLSSDWFDPEWMFGVKKGFDIAIANPPYVRQEGIRDIKPKLKEQFGAFFCGTADLYTYFFKHSLDMLKPGGHLCFIAPNKFMRAGYGKQTRRLLSRSATPKVVIDFGELPVFEAGTDPSIIVVENRESDNEDFTAAVIKTKEDIMRLGEIIGLKGFKMKKSDLSPQGWTLVQSEILNLMKKISNLGTPLGEYIRGRFYRGVLTGFNKAFVIDEETREKLIAEDSRSEELIKPWLRGRDIKKWKSDWAGLYIIAIPSSANREWPWSIMDNEEKARNVFSSSYPAIHKHLSQWEKELKKRDDQGKFWWELRACKYYEEFKQPKIIYPIVAKEMRASFYNETYYINDKNFMIPIKDYLLMAIMNSKTMDFYYRLNFAGHGDLFNKGRIEFRGIFMSNLPVAPPSEVLKSSIEERIGKILDNPSGPEVKRLESEIDRLVYELYQLTDEEIAIIEGENG